MDDFITDEIVRNEQVRRMTETEHYGRRLLQTKLRRILSSFWGH